MGGLFVDVYVEWLIRMVVNDIRMFRSRSWPVVDGIVFDATCPRALGGCHVADVYYDYTFSGESFSGIHEEPFVAHSLGQDYILQFPTGSDYPVRVNPRDPSKSVAVRG
jgi:hypothetical protein